MINKLLINAFTNHGEIYEEILNAERLGLIEIIRYDEFILSKKSWLIKIIKEQYNASENQPDYRFFLKNKFDWILKIKTD